MRERVLSHALLGLRFILAGSNMNFRSGDARSPGAREGPSDLVSLVNMFRRQMLPRFRYGAHEERTRERALSHASRSRSEQVDMNVWHWEGPALPRPLVTIIDRSGRHDRCGLVQSRIITSWVSQLGSQDVLRANVVT
jgi:hypothetical protein